MILLPGFRTVPGMNVREHHMARSRRVQGEKERVGCELKRLREKPPLPCVVTLTRLAPSSGLDDDNLIGSMKSVRDAVAAWLGVDDKDRTTVRYEYAQQRGPWAVGIAFSGWAQA